MANGLFRGIRSNLLNAESIRIVAVQGYLIRHRIYEKEHLATNVPPPASVTSECGLISLWFWFQEMYYRKYVYERFSFVERFIANLQALQSLTYRRFVLEKFPLVLKNDGVLQWPNWSPAGRQPPFGPIWRALVYGIGLAARDNPLASRTARTQQHG
jgi:hypothetical protein